MALNIYIILIGLAIIISGPLAPFVIIIKSLIKRRTWKKLNNNYASNYWLNNEEKVVFLDSHINYKTLQSEINKVELEIDELYDTADNENIKRNDDNAISNRSHRGKELNKEINSLRELRQSTLSEQSKHNSIIYSLKNKPIRFWLELREPYVQYYSYLYTLYFWLIIFYFLVNYFFKKPFFALYEMYASVFLGANSFIILKSDWGWKILLILITCAILSIIFNYITEYVIKKYFFNKKYPKPPIVNLENYDTINL